MSTDDLDAGSTHQGLRPGQTVFNQRFTLRRVLGRGGMGVVWLAHDADLGMEVALKFLPRQWLASSHELEELRREARRSRGLTHPHIVRIHDFLRDEQGGAIAMEYVDGDTLANLRVDQPDGVFSPAQLSPWINQLCSALVYAHHDARIVHRDLKPANLLIDARAHLKITDFGIARSSGGRTAPGGSTLGGQFSGSLPYMSPQQTAGEPPTAADDVYALGATLYELLTGKAPFYVGGPAAILNQIHTRVPPSLAARRHELGVSLAAPAIPEEWETAIAACLAKDPTQRPIRLNAFASRLMAAHTESLEPVAREGFDPSVPARRRLGPLLLIGGVAVALTAGAVAYHFATQRAEQVRRDERARVEAAAALARSEREAKTRQPSATDLGGIILVTTPPGAHIQLAGHAAQRTPATIQNLPPGRHSVLISLADHVDQTQEIEVEANRFSRINLTLVSKLGMANLSSYPTGLDYVLTGPDKQTRRGKTPAREENLPVGTYQYLVYLHANSTDGMTFKVKAGELANVTLDRRAATLELDSFPSGFSVLDHQEKNLGTTPLSITGLDRGNHSFTLRKGPYSKRFSVTMKSGETLRSVQTLDFPHRGDVELDGCVRLPGSDVLISKMEILDRDYNVFAKAVGRKEFPPLEIDPRYYAQAARVSWTQAQAYCAWRTENSRSHGSLWTDQRFRLPTDHEWSLAVGLQEDASLTPAQKHLKLPGLYPWGNAWPPPERAGNYAPLDGTLRPVSQSGPVGPGQFRANGLGLRDLGGNVWEWVEDRWDHGSPRRVLRGASYLENSPEVLLSSYRRHDDPDAVRSDCGFRIVLELGSSTTPPAKK
jgi:hypothetical protein